MRLGVAYAVVKEEVLIAADRAGVVEVEAASSIDAVEARWRLHVELPDDVALVPAVDGQSFVGALVRYKQSVYQLLPT